MKILYWDIETAPMVVATWGLFNQNIGYDAIIKDWYMICAAWRWHGTKKIETVSLLDDSERFALDISDDYEVTRKLHEVLSEADVLVGHNGDAFDLKKFNARAIYHGFDPLPPIATVDTLKVARKHFKISSNRLDYLGTFLKCGAKVSTPKGLWMRALKGEKAAIKTMVKYNKGDIVLLQNVYDKLLPFINNHPNYNLFSDNLEPVCPKCGSFNMTKQGTRVATRLGKRQQFKCSDCGGWATGEVTERTMVR
jgi:hypothetical protein